MFAIEVNFLTGRYVATAHHDRRQSEWPPHPARLFSALVATWADSDHPDPDERRALEWLESQPPPGIRVPDATPRSVVTHFVPVNDARIIAPSSYLKRVDRVDDLCEKIAEAKAAGQPKQLKSLRTNLRKQRDVSGIVSSTGSTPVESAIDLLPPGWLSTPGHMRSGQARAYPSMTLSEPRVTYVWSTYAEESVGEALDGLCSRLSRLGHSSSLVSCRTVQSHPPPNLRPGEGARVIRGVRPGQLLALRREHAKHKGSKPRTMPFTPVRYRESATDESPSIVRPDTAGEWLVLAFQPRSRRLPSTRTVEVATVLRGAVFHHAADPLPEGLSGHRNDGRPSASPHVGFLTLPWVGNEHADSRLMGVAINLPECLDDPSRRAALRSIGTWEKAQDPLLLKLGKNGTIAMERIVGPAPLVSLRRSRWSRSSRRWATATPIALPTHPGALGRGTAAARSKAWGRAEQAIVDSCRHVGLPEPVAIVGSLAPLIPGVRPAPSFPAFRQRGKGGSPVARRLVHASLIFEHPVGGPLVLGAGRYLGLGLMMPIDDREPTDA